MKIFKIFLLCCAIQFTQQRIIKTKNNSKLQESKKTDFIFDQNRPQIIVQPSGDINSMYSKTSKINIGEVPELKPQPIQQNYPLFEMNEKNGLDKFGAIAADLFKMDPADILSENEMHQSLDDFKDSIEESKMKYPILIPPTILKSMVYYLKQIDQYRQKQKEKEDLKKRDENSVNLTKEQMQEKQIEERLSNNAKDMRNIEEAIQGLTNKVANLKALKMHQEEVKEEEERLAKLKREQEAEQKKQAILLKEEQIQEDLIRIEKEELDLDSQNIQKLEKEKKILEEDLQKLIEQEASSDKIAKIEKALEQLDLKIQKKQENVPENQKKQIMLEKEKLMMEEEKEAEKFVTEEVISIEGDLSSSQMKLAKQQIKTLKDLVEKLLKKLPSKNKLVYKNDYDIYLKLVIDLHNFQRLFEQYYKFCHNQIQSLKDKMQRIELNTEGIVTYLEKNDVYTKIKKKTYPNDAKIFNWDSQLHKYADKLSESFKLYINNLQVILNSFTAIKSLIDNAQFNDEKNSLMTADSGMSISEDMYNTKKDIVEQINDNLIESFKRIRKILDNSLMMKDNESEMKLVLTNMDEYINQKENIETQEMKDNKRKEQLEQQITTGGAQISYSKLLSITALMIMLI